MKNTLPVTDEQPDIEETFCQRMIRISDQAQLKHIREQQEEERLKKGILEIYDKKHLSYVSGIDPYESTEKGFSMSVFHVDENNVHVNLKPWNIDRTDKSAGKIIATHYL